MKVWVEGLFDSLTYSASLFIESCPFDGILHAWRSQSPSLRMLLLHGHLLAISEPSDWTEFHAKPFFFAPSTVLSCHGWHSVIDSHRRTVPTDDGTFLCSTQFSLHYSYVNLIIFFSTAGVPYLLFCHNNRRWRVCTISVISLAFTFQLILQMHVVEFGSNDDRLIEHRLGVMESALISSIFLGSSSRNCLIFHTSSVHKLSSEMIKMIGFVSSIRYKAVKWCRK